MILAGDFNDWRHRAGDPLGKSVPTKYSRRPAGVRPCFPARLPILRLDRIYVRGFHVQSAQVHRGRDWSRLSDHAPLAANLVLA